MKKKLTVIPLFFFFLIISFAQEKKIDFVEYDLDNGMHVILHQDNSTPIVAVSIMYHVGAKNEQPNKTGFAHFFEHLMFEGSPNIERGEFFKIVQSNGGILNANTDFDRTYYFEVMPSNKFELGLWLESERMLQLKIDSIGVETQRGVVIEEKRQSYDNRPYGSILSETFSHAYKKHPYRWITIGDIEHIKSATLEEFKAFHDMYYVPNNAVLSIAGDIDLDEAKELIEKYFGEIPRGTKPIYRPNANRVARRFEGKKVFQKEEINTPDIVEPAQTEEVRDEVYDNIQLPAVIMAYHIPEREHEDYYAIQMLSTLLSGGQSSRMNKAIVDEQQKAVFAGSFPLALEDPGLLLSFAIVNMGVEASDLENSMNTEVEKVKNELISEKEFQKLRNQIENNFVSSNSTVSGIAQSLATYYTYQGDASLINTELDKYMEVTKEDIQRVAKKYLAKKNRVVLHYLPKAQQKKEEK